MAYLAIARKWRPQRFEDIVGQVHVTRTLQNAITLGRVHHAFLFTGARGVGKTTAARILAKALNCEKGPTVNPCNQCRSCQEITAGIANDVQEIDGASNNGVEHVRELRDKLRYLPASGKYRIYVVDEVHMLSVQAFNALLKTLEEPPAHVIFIFATTDPQKVPDTILSRCQRFDFKRIPLRAIAEKLGEIARAEGVEVSEVSLRMIATEAEGSMRDAQSLLDQVVSSSGGAVSDQEVVNILGLLDRRMVFDCISGVLEHQPERSLEVVGRVHDFGFDMKSFARQLLEVVRHLTVVKVATKPERIVDAPAEELVQLQALAKGVSLEEISRQFRILLEGFDEIARSEAPRLVLEMTLLRMAQVRPVQPVGELLLRLNGLESVLRQVATSGSAGSAQGPSGGNVASGHLGGASRGAPAPQHSPRPPLPSAGPRPGLEESAGPRPGLGRPQSLSDTGRAPSASFSDGVPLPEEEDDDDHPAGGGVVLPASAPAPLHQQAPAAAPRSSRGAPSDPAEGLSPIAAMFASRGPSSGRGGDGEATGISAPDSRRGGRPSDVSSPEGLGGTATSQPGQPRGSSPSGAPGAPASSPAFTDVGARWRAFIDWWFDQEDVFTRPLYLKQANVVREDGCHFILGLRRDMLVKSTAKEASESAVLGLLERFLGQPGSIECVLLPEGAVAGASYAEWAEQVEQNRRGDIERAAKAHPKVQQALAIFGVRASEVRVELENRALEPG